MYRAVVAIFAVVTFCGCSPASTSLSGEPQYSQYRKSGALWEDIVVYGRLQREILSKPTAVYNSAFGHAFCMSEEVTFEVTRYIVGTGPRVLKFSQNKIDSCAPIADSTGFGDAILFVHKNEPRGVWSDYSARIRNIDGKTGIFLIEEIVLFALMDGFEDLFAENAEPYKMTTQDWLVSERQLQRLEELGVLTYSVSPKDNRMFLLEMRKHISLEKLLKRG